MLSNSSPKDNDIEELRRVVANADEGELIQVSSNIFVGNGAVSTWILWILFLCMFDNFAALYIDILDSLLICILHTFICIQHF